jgi:hypothetical protein
MVTIRTVEEAYQMALKAEEKLSRRQGQRGRGRSQPRGKAVAQERTQSPKKIGRGLRVKLKEVEPHSRGRKFLSRGGNKMISREDMLT